MHRIQKTIEEFLQCDEPSKQIISLGAGFDTTYFLLKQKYSESNFTYIEIDFPDICLAKSEKFLQSEQLTSLIGEDFTRNSEILTLNYKLLHGDLRESQPIEQKLRTFTLKEAPTLIIAECVFSYIDSDKIDELINRLCLLYDNLAFVIYDIIEPNDAFGRIMTKNLNTRGITLKGIQKYPSLNSQISRFSKWFEHVQGFNMLEVYNTCVDRQEKNR